jgi:superfamily I DNA/RNA helicase
MLTVEGHHNAVHLPPDIHILLNSPPGTGKTELLARRTEYLIHTHSIQPSTIVHLTHTNAATDNTSERLRRTLGDDISSNIRVSTMHSLCNDLISCLRDNPYQQFTPITDEERKIEIHKLATEASLPYETILKMCDVLDRHPKDNHQEFWYEKCDELVNAITSNPKYLLQKASGLNADGRRRLTVANTCKDMFPLYNIYRKRLVEIKKYTHDQVLSMVLDIIRTNEELREKIHKQFKFIMVDEYQDIGQLQYEILKSFRTPTTYFMLVGDSNQSVYSFNNVTKFPFQKFIDDVDSTKVAFVNLKDNYRSTPSIVAVSNRLMGTDNRSHQSETGSESEQTYPRPRLLVYPSRKDEVSATCNMIGKLVLEEQVPPDSICVLFRSHKMSTEYEVKLQILGVPCAPTRDPNLLSSSEANGVVLLLRWMTLERSMSTAEKPDTEGVLFTILHNPYALGRFTPLANNVDRALYVMRQNGIKTWRNLYQQRFDVSNIPEDVLSALEQLEQAITWAHCHRPSRVLAGLYNLFGTPTTRNIYWSIINHAMEQETRQDTLTLYSVSDYYDVLKSCCEMGLRIPLLQDAIHKQNAVQLMTCHSVKSLGFKYVFIPECTRNVWSIKDKLLDHLDGSLEERENESRRLFNVIVSRSECHLCLSYSAEKNGRPCIFLSELKDANLIDEEHFENEGNNSNGTNNEVLIVQPPPSTNFQFEDFIMPDMSYSTLVTEEKCTLHARYEFVLGVRVPPPIKQGDHSREMSRQFGITFHRVMDELHKLLSLGECDIDIDKFLHDTFTTLPTSRLPEVKHFVTSRIGSWKLMHSDPEWSIKTEVMFTATINDNIRIKGRVDALVVHGNKVTIYDWKTGKFDKTAFADNTSDVNTQAAFYTLLIQLQPQFENKEVVVIFDYVTEPKPEKPLYLDKESISKIRKRIVDSHNRLSKCTTKGCGLVTCSWCNWQIV